MKQDDWRPDIEAVWEYYDRRILGRGGEWTKAECPLVAHEDNNPSASVNLDSGKWQCWSCEGRGDAIDIIQANEESCAGFTDALAFAKEHFAGGGRAVRNQRGSGGGLSVRTSSRSRGGNWQPPWRGL